MILLNKLNIYSSFVTLRIMLISGKFRSLFEHFTISSKGSYFLEKRGRESNTLSFEMLISMECIL